MKSVYSGAVILIGTLLLAMNSSSQTNNHQLTTNLKREATMDTITIPAREKEAIRNLYENILNGRNWDQLKDLVSDEYINPQGHKGADGFKEQILSILKGFPDAKWKIEDIMAEGNRVVAMQRIEGTQTNDFQNIPATGKTISTTATSFFTFKNGRIFSSRIETDRVGFMQQLGILPTDLTGLQRKAGGNAIRFIEQFSMPYASRQEFMQRMKQSQQLLETLPGFISMETYESTDTSGNLSVITIATWQNRDNINQARETVQAEVKQSGFNREEFYQRLHIVMQRGLYEEVK